MQQLTLGATLSSGLAKEPQQWSEADHWRTNLQLMFFSGDANYAESLGATFPLQSTAHPTGLWLTEASVERQPGQNGIGIKAGVFSLNPGFVSAPMLEAYVHSALNDTLNHSVEGLPINPFAAPGLQLSWRLELTGRWGE